MRRVLLVGLLVSVAFLGIAFAVKPSRTDPLKSKLEKFFGSKDYVVTIQKDINHDNLVEIVAVKKSERDKNGILKGIVLQNNNEGYQTLLEVTPQGVWGKNKKELFSDEKFDPKDLSSWQFVPYETVQGTGFNLAMIKKDGFITEDLVFYWDEKQREYLLFSF